MKKKILIILSILFILLSIYVIHVGIDFYKKSMPSSIMGECIQSIENILENYIFSYQDIQSSDNFSLHQDISFSILSDYYEKNDSYFKQLNQSKVELSIEQDSLKKKLLLQLIHTLNNQEELNSKYYVEDSTQYYFVNTVLNQYINNGNSYYFENINDQQNMDYNINYLYSFVFNSFKKQFKNSYFKSYQVKRKILNEEKDVLEISLTINNKLLNQIFEGILKDLQKDKIASRILSNMIPSFKKLKWKDKKIFINNDSYTFNIYYSKYLYKLLKLELISLNEENKKIVEYHVIDTNKGKIYIISNDLLKYDIDISFETNQMNLSILDSKSNQVGLFYIKKKDFNREMHFELMDNSANIDISIHSEFKNEKKGMFLNQTMIDFDLLFSNEKDLKGNINVLSKYSDVVNIYEEVEDAILQKKLG
ncbi:MAG: hypothetical protein IKE70_02435, partial [Bacilli bacterium]|nr:hypothetical protein [Bacilli bacterium]